MSIKRHLVGPKAFHMISLDVKPRSNMSGLDKASYGSGLVWWVFFQSALAGWYGTVLPLDAGVSILRSADAVAKCCCASPQQLTREKNRSTSSLPYEVLSSPDIFDLGLMSSEII